MEFFSVLLKASNEVAEKELVSSGAIQRILDLFFEYPYNNLLHHHVESIITSCLESKNVMLVEHVFQDCNLIGKIIEADRHSILSSDSNLPTVPSAGRQSPRTGNIGHITRIANKLVQMGNNNGHIHAYLQENTEWIDWHTSVLHERNNVENVYQWACGRPTALHERTRDSDEDELHDRDYDVAALANNLSQAFRYNMYEDEDAEEVHGSLERDDEDTYFDDESAEVVISSLRLGDDQESSCLFTNSNWFAFQETGTANGSLSTSSMEKMDEINLNDTATVCNGGSNIDDEVVVGEDGELVDGRTSIDGTSGTGTNFMDTASTENVLSNGGVLNCGEECSSRLEKTSIADDPSLFRFETTDNGDLSGDRRLPDWVTWRESSDFQVDGSGRNPFKDDVELDIDCHNPQEVVGTTVDSCSNGEIKAPNGLSGVLGSSGLVETGTSRQTMPSLFEEDVEFVGVELEGTKKAMEQALKEGIVGEASPLKRSIATKIPEKEKPDGDVVAVLEFNDINYWQVDKEVGVGQE